MYIFGIVLMVAWTFLLYLYFDARKKANRTPKMISFKQYKGEHPSLRGLDADKDILYSGANAFEARRVLDRNSIYGSAMIIDSDVLSYNLVYTETFDTRNYKTTFTVEKVDIYKGKNYKEMIDNEIK